MKVTRAQERPVCIGIDPSLVGTGLSVVVDGDVIYAHGWTDKTTHQKTHHDQLSFFKIEDAQSHSHRIHRIEVMVDWTLSVIDGYLGNNLYVAIEGYALSQKGNRVSDQHEQGGILKQMLWDRGISFRIYPPQAMKYAWTGKGNASKSLMLMSCYKHFGLDYTHLLDAGENLADAVLTAQLLYCEVELKAGRKLGNVPKTVEKELRKPGKDGVCAVDRGWVSKYEKNFAKPRYGG